MSYGYGNGRGNTNGLPTATNDFQVLSERNLELNEGPTNLSRRHTATISGRFEVPWLRGLAGEAVARMTSGLPFSIINTNVDADRNNIAADPVEPGTYSGNGQNAITVENKRSQPRLRPRLPAWTRRARASTCTLPERTMTIATRRVDAS